MGMNGQPPIQQTPLTFEQQFGQRIFSMQNAEKSYTDKLLAKEDVRNIQDLVKKEDLTRSELLEILYLLSSSEIKLANFSEWDRYLLGKFLAWIRDFVSICEILYDYKEKYDKFKETDNEDNKTEVSTAIGLEVSDYRETLEVCFSYVDDDTKKAKIDEMAKAFEKGLPSTMKDIINLMENNRKFMLHNIKFLVDIFLYLSRSTLSLGMNAFEILSTSKFEYAYSDIPGMKPTEEQAKSPFKINLRG